MLLEVALLDVTIADCGNRFVFGGRIMSAGKYGVATEQIAEASCTACGAGKCGVATRQTAEVSCTACGHESPRMTRFPQSAVYCS